MNNKILLIFAMMIFLVVPMVSAFEFDNKLTYSNNDMKVKIENAFGLGEELGTAELKSHNSVTEIKQFGFGEEEVVMYYDFEGWSGNVGGLGEVEFINMNTGETVEKDYTFVEWKEIEVPTYTYSCSEFSNGTIKSDCSKIQSGITTEFQWVELTDNNIKNARIGLKTYVGRNDWIDGIWTIEGKKVKKHITWGGAGGLTGKTKHYYKWDSNDLTDSIFTLNGTNTGTTNIPGKINDARYSEGTTFINYTTDSFEESITYSFWFMTNSTGCSGNGCLFYYQGNAATSIAEYITLLGTEIKYVFGAESGNNNAFDTSGAGITVDTWTHVVITGSGDAAADGYEIWVNGVNISTSFTPGGGNRSRPDGTEISHTSGISHTFTGFTGRLDEFLIGNATMNEEEIQFLYDDGNACGYLNDNCNLPKPTITLDSPANNTNYTATNNVTFNATIFDATNITNVTLFIDDVGNETNLTAGLNNTLWTFDIEGFAEADFFWNIQACNFNNICGNATARTFEIDTTNPVINFIYPTNNTFLDGVITVDNVSIDINWTATDTNLDTCWYNNETANVTITCDANATIFLPYGQHTFSVYANDTSGGETNSTITGTWNYKIFYNETSNAAAFETDNETFFANLSANSSLTGVILDYNGTNYTTTQYGIVWNKTIDIPTGIQNNTFKYYFTYAGETLVSDNFYQNVSETVFTLCNSSYTTKFLNLTFKNEADLTSLNATIPTSNYVYYLGNGTVNKTYTLINNTKNSEYDFCATPDQTMYVDPYVQYKNGTTFPQRIWDAATTIYTSTLTNKILYLLSTSDGIYVTFQVINPADQLLNGVEVNATRVIDGSTVVVGTGTTSSSGTVTFWLNPDFQHTFGFSNTGYTTYIYSDSPTQAAYTITLQGTTSVSTVDCVRGTYPEVYPSNNELINDTSYNFEFNMTSTYWELSSFGFDLRLPNGTIVGTQSSTVEGTPATQSYDVNNQTGIYMDYYWKVDDTDCPANVTSNYYWVIVNDEYSSWSLKTLFSDLNTYMDSGLFGLDNFGRILISFLILFLSVGMMSYKYGFTSPLSITFMTFMVTFFLDIVVGVIPTIRGINNLLVYITGLVLFAVVINEGMRR